MRQRPRGSAVRPPESGRLTNPESEHTGSRERRRPCPQDDGDELPEQDPLLADPGGHEERGGQHRRQRERCKEAGTRHTDPDQPASEFRATISSPPRLVLLAGAAAYTTVAECPATDRPARAHHRHPGHDLGHQLVAMQIAPVIDGDDSAIVGQTPRSRPCSHTMRRTGSRQRRTRRCRCGRRVVGVGCGDEADPSGPRGRPGFAHRCRPPDDRPHAAAVHRGRRLDRRTRQRTVHPRF